MQEFLTAPGGVVLPASIREGTDGGTGGMSGGSKGLEEKATDRSGDILTGLRSISDGVVESPNNVLTSHRPVADGRSDVTVQEGEKLASVPDDTRMTPKVLGQMFLRMVSERTGYPIEMLDPQMNLEADLGIDSIKRVEVLGAFQRQTGLIGAKDMEHVAGLKTLQQIIDFLTKLPRTDQALTEESPRTQGQTQTFPFIGTITSTIPGQELVASQ